MYACDRMPVTAAIFMHTRPEGLKSPAPTRALGEHVAIIPCDEKSVVRFRGRLVGIGAINPYGVPLAAMEPPGWILL